MIGLSLALSSVAAGVKATLEMSFLSSVPSGLTFSRASPATRFNSAGLLEVVGNDVPRIDYDPARKTPRGLRVEEERVNRLVNSRDIDATWHSRTDVTVTRNQVGIDGVANRACLVQEGVSGASLTGQNGLAVTSGATVAGSVYVKKGVGDWWRLIVAETNLTDGVNFWFNVTTGESGVFSARGAGTPLSATVEDVGNGWWRIKVACRPAPSYTIPNISLVSAAGNNSGTRNPNSSIITDCWQLELGENASSVIITGAAPVTRAADVPTIVGSTFTTAYNPSAGTMLLGFEREAFDSQPGSVVLVQAEDTTANDRTALRLGGRTKTAAAQLTTAAGGIVYLNHSGGGVSNLENSPQVAGCSYRVGVGQVGRGSVVNTPNITQLSALPTRFSLGQGPGAVALGGWVRSFSYYNKALDISGMV